MKMYLLILLPGGTRIIRHRFCWTWCDVAAVLLLDVVVVAIVVVFVVAVRRRSISAVICASQCLRPPTLRSIIWGDVQRQQCPNSDCANMGLSSFCVRCIWWTLRVGFIRIVLCTERNPFVEIELLDNWILNAVDWLGCLTMMSRSRRLGLILYRCSWVHVCWPDWWRQILARK